MPANFKILTSFWFITGLTILLLNDLILKAVYGNWITGKLSDFAGLFVFSIFWSTFLPKYKKAIFWLTSLFFIFWKSAYSQSFIDFLNGFSIIQIHRVIDYSDYISLLILPVAYYVETQKEKAFLFKMNPAISIVLSSFAFMATSYRTNIEMNQSYHFDFPIDTLTHRMESMASLHFVPDLALEHSNPDTLNFQMPSDFCFQSVEVNMIISGEGNTSSDIKLISIQHRCPKSKNQEEKLRREFEKRIVSKLQKN